MPAALSTPSRPAVGGASPAESRAGPRRLASAAGAPKVGAPLGETMMSKALTLALAILAGAPLPALAQGQPVRPDQAEFRALYKELVETNTTLSAGSCTLA